MDVSLPVVRSKLLATCFTRFVTVELSDDLIIIDNCDAGGSSFGMVVDDVVVCGGTSLAVIVVVL